MITPKLTYFPVTQVAGCRCTLLSGNSFISLAGSGEQINLCQQSPSFRKLYSCFGVIFRSFPQNFPLCAPVSFFCSIYLCISRFSRDVFRCAPGFETYRSQPSITAASYKCLLTRGLMLRTREKERETRGRVGEDPGNEAASFTERLTQSP